LQILFRFDNRRHAVIEMMELMSCIAKGHWELVKTDFSTAINFEKKTVNRFCRCGGAAQPLYKCSGL